MEVLNLNLHKHKNKRKLANVLVICFLGFSLFLLSGCSLLNFSKGSVEGYVYEETIVDTRPLEEALVSITGSPNTALTDTDGYFRIDEVSIGARTLTITKANYITYKIVNVVIKADEVTLIDNGNPIVIRAVNDKYQELINDYPDSLYADDAQLGIGNCYYATYDYSHAIETYQKAIDNYPESPLLALAQYSIAQSYRKLENYGQAVIEYNSVIDNYPESSYPAASQYYIGYSYYLAQDYTQAIFEFQLTVDNYPDSIWPGESDWLIAPFAQYYIGWCYGQKLGQWSDAITAYQLVIDNYPVSTWGNGQEIPPDAQYQIGWSYEQLELWAEGITAYQLVIDNYPGSTWGGGGSIPDDAQARIEWINDNHPPS